jgi:hypothetical protein
MRRLSARRRWYLLGAFWIVVLALGIGGFRQQAREAGIDRSFLDTLYLTFQLVTLDYGESSDLNWRLEVARFIAPLVAVGTILQTVSVVFRAEFARWRVRFLSGHTVVLGLGVIGSRVANALADTGRTVVGVDADTKAPGVSALRRRGVTVLVSDPSDVTLLPSLRLGVARDVVVTCGSDAKNVTIAQQIRRTVRPPRLPALRCAVELTDAELCGLLRGGDLEDNSLVRVDFFNLHERAARSLIAAHPPFADDREPHLVILGLGQLGRSVVVAAAQNWAVSNSTPLRVTLIDRVASGRWEALRLQHPALPEVCAATTLDLDLDAPKPGTVARFEAIFADAPTWVAALFEDEATSLSAALLARQTMRDATVPVIVRTRTRSGIAELLAGGDQEPFPGYHVFPFLDNACTPEVVEGGVREEIARAIHAEYLASGATGGFSRPWEELTDDQKESSRRAADDLLENFDVVRCDIIPMRHWGESHLQLSKDEVERLASLEHQRWLQERRQEGWTHGTTRDDVAKTNPLLVEWDELDRVARAQQRATVRELPQMLARSGFEAVRRRPESP